MNRDMKYDNIIMSWSCFGDFVLVSQSIKTLIDDGQVTRGIIITHQKELRGLLAKHENIKLVYPTQNLKDLLFLFSIFFKRNIFVLHDMPSHNRFSKQIRLLMSVFLTRMKSSKLLLLIDDSFLPDATTKLSEKFAHTSIKFSIVTKVHISQYILNILSDSHITQPVICTYDIELNEEEFNLPVKYEYITIHGFASNMNKSLSEKWYLDLVKEINNIFPNLPILLLGGPTDAVKISKIVSNTKNTYNISLGYTFRKMLYAIKKSKITINVPSGPAHYAAFYKKAQLLIWQEHNTYSYIPTFNPRAKIVLNNFIYSPKDVYDIDTDTKLKLPDIRLVIDYLKVNLNS